MKIILGSGKRVYYIHPGILASCNSSVLEARMTWRWKINNEYKPLDWSDFDEQTVECVLSYFYTRDYYVPGSTPGSAPSYWGVVEGKLEQKNKG